MFIHTICIPQTAHEQTRYAAEELRYYFMRMTGKFFAVCSEASDNAVFLEQVCDEVLGEDGFSLVPEGTCVHIRGGKRGILYGAYELLERLGCRFFTPECERVPVLPYIAISLEGPVKQIPVLKYREHNYADLCRSPRFAVKSRVNGHLHHIPEKLGGNMSYAWFVHTFDKLVPTEIYGETHPEYYALLADGTRPQTPHQFQLCLTNPDVLEIAVDSVRQVLREKPQARFVSISQNDWFGNCQCEKCLATDRQEGSPAGTLLRFVNGIAERLENEFPHVTFDTLAYTYNRIPPKITRPRHNVCVRLCTIEACFSHSFESCDDENHHIRLPDGTHRPLIDDLAAWGQVSDQMYIWDYTTSFAHYPAPHPNWHVLQPNMRAFIRYHAKGVFEQANGALGGGVDMNELRAYVITKLLWDADTDVQRHITEFTDCYYGAAAPYVREYIETLCRKAEEDNIHVGFNDELTSPLFDEAMLDVYDGILSRGERAVEQEALLCRRIQKIRLSIRWVRLKRKAMYRHEHDAEEINTFFADWQSFGLTRIDEWVSPQTTLRALLDDRWRGTEYYAHCGAEGADML